MACLKKILIAKRSLSFTQKLALDIFESDDRSHAFWYENFVELIFDIIGKMHVVDAVASDVAIPAVSYVALVLDDGEAERHLAHVWARDQGIWVFIEDDFAQKKREIGEDYSCPEFFPFDIIRWWFDDWEHEKSPNQNHEKGKKTRWIRIRNAILSECKAMSNQRFFKAPEMLAIVAIQLACS
jgi:hypothetical protein